MIEIWLQACAALFGSLAILGLAKLGLMRLAEVPLRKRNEVRLAENPIRGRVGSRK